jgi:hypothetical protein
LSSCSREELSNFISTSVLPQTGQVYSKEFLQWKDFVKSETGSDDPLLTGKSDNDKAALVSLMMMRRHQGKGRDVIHSYDTADVRTNNFVHSISRFRNHSHGQDVVKVDRVQGPTANSKPR